MKKFATAFIVAVCLLVTVACAECVYFDTYGDHDWVYGKTEAKCDTPGEAYRDCAECGAHDIQETIAAPGHAWEEKSLISEPSCENDGEKLVECTVCGEQKYLILPALGHTFGDWETVKNATCTDEGERKSDCITCGISATEVIERTSHDYGNWRISVEATDNSMGRRYRKCEECGATNEDSFYPEGTLYRGMQKSDDVKEMQLKLMQLGFLADKADGIFGKNTEAAVIAFQTENGLEATGIAYPETINAILYATADETDSTVEPAESCAHTISENGEISVIYCTRHQDMVNEAAAEYANAAIKLVALKSICGNWEAELNGLYNSMLENADDTFEENIIAARENYFESMRLHEAVIAKVFNSDDETVYLHMIEEYVNKCADICGCLNMDN